MDEQTRKVETAKRHFTMDNISFTMDNIAVKNTEKF